MSHNNFDNESFFNEYIKLRETGPNRNSLLEQPAIRALLPDLIDKSIIDLGCGDGSNCMDFINQGAIRVVGVDVSRRMLTKALVENASPLIEYRLLDLKDISSIESRFDLAYSSLTFHYVEDIDRLMSDVNKLLNEKGYLVFSQEHPLTTAPLDGPGWLNDDVGSGMHYKLSDYLLPGQRNTTWLGANVIKYHRPISKIINAIIGGGFVIEEVREPIPNDELLDSYPAAVRELHKPSFLIFKARKVGT